MLGKGEGVAVQDTGVLARDAGVCVRPMGSEEARPEESPCSALLLWICQVCAS